VLDAVAVLAHALHDRVQDLAHFVDQPRYRGIGADGPAVAAGRALLGDPFGMLEADGGHVAEQGRAGGHHAEADERVGDVVVAHTPRVEVARLLPEAMDVRHRRLALGQGLDHQRYLRCAARGLARDRLGDRPRLDFDDLVEAALDHAHVVLDDARALRAELVLQLVADRVEQLGVAEPRLLHDGRGGEKGTLEGDTLHAQLQVGVGRLFPGDLEAVDGEDLEALVDDHSLKRRGDVLPDLLRGTPVALDDEDAAVLESGQRVGMVEHVRVGRQHHVDVVVLAVDADRLGRRREVIRRGLALLLRAVLGVGLDVEAQEVEQRHGQVLTGGDGAPAPDGVEPHGDAVGRHQVRVLRAPHGQLPDVGIGLFDGLLVHLLLWRDRFVAQEVDGQVEQALARAVGQHVLHGPDDPLGLQVAAAKAEGPGVKGRNIGQLPIGLQLGVGRVLGILAVFRTAADRRTDLAHDRQVHGQRLVQPLEHRAALLALDDPSDQVGGKRAKHDQVDDPDPEPAFFAQVVHHGLGAGDQAALAHDEVFGVVGPVGHHPPVLASGQLAELREGAVRQLLDVVEEEGPLRRHALHVGVLVLNQAGHHRIVHVPQLRDATPRFAVDDPLGRRGRFDDVVRPPQILGDQLPLGHQHRLDQVGRQEAVLRHHAGGQRQLGDAVGDDVQVGRRLGVLGEHLKEARVVDAMVVVMTGVHVQVGLGHRASADVQNVRQALAHRGVERFVHVGDALAGREVGRAQTGHGHPRRHRGGRVLAFGLDEDQGPAGDVDEPPGGVLGPVLAHLGRGGDRVGAGSVGRLALAHDDRGVAVHRGADAGVLEIVAPRLRLLFRLATERQYGHRNPLFGVGHRRP
jgi:hypothetical protein